MKPFCYIDVDLTLVDLDGRLYPEVRPQLTRLYQKYTLVCWSAGGAEYAEQVLKANNVRGYFKYVLSKAFICIDDEPSSITGKARIVRIRSRKSWGSLWTKVFGKRLHE